MDVTIHARHTTVPESLRNQATQRIRRLRRFDASVGSATAVFDGQNGRKLVEVRVVPEGKPPLLAHGQGPTFRSALGRSLDRIERQLKRNRERQLGRRTRMVKTADEIA